MRGLGLGFTNPIGTEEVLYACLCLGCGGVGGEWESAWNMVWKSGMVLCLCESELFV